MLKKKGTSSSPFFFLDFSNDSVQSSEAIFKISSVIVKSCVVQEPEHTAWDSRSLFPSVVSSCGTVQGLWFLIIAAETVQFIQSVVPLQRRLCPSRQVRGPPGAALCNLIVRQHGWVLFSVRMQWNTSGRVKSGGIRWSGTTAGSRGLHNILTGTFSRAHLKHFHW